MLRNQQSGSRERLSESIIHHLSSILGFIDRAWE